jgi:hypothetical protein
MVRRNGRDRCEWRPLRHRRLHVRCPSPCPVSLPPPAALTASSTDAAASVRFSITPALPAASGLPNSCKSKSIARNIWAIREQDEAKSKPHKAFKRAVNSSAPTRSRTDSPIHTAFSNLFTGGFRSWQLAFLTRRYHVHTCMRRALWYRNLWFH